MMSNPIRSASLKVMLDLLVVSKKDILNVAACWDLHIVLWQMSINS